MARHRFTKAQRIAGMKALLRSRKVGAAQKAGIRKALKKLEK